MLNNYIFKWVIIIILIVLSVEIGLRYFLGLANPPLLISNPKIEYLFKPNQEVDRFGNRIVYNSFSMRNKGEPFENNKVILVTGDSVVNGGSLTNQNDLATFLTEKKLQKINDEKYFVANISAGSWGPKNNLEYFREYGFFGASSIIYVISSHDLYDNPTYEDLDRHMLPERGYKLALQELVQKYFLYKIKAKLFSNLGTVNDDSQLLPKTTLPVIDEFMKFAGNYVRTRCIIMHPTRQEFLGNGRDDYELLIEQMMLLSNVLLVDGSDYLSKYSYRDNIHLNELGQKQLSNAIMECIEI